MCRPRRRALWRLASCARRCCRAAGNCARKCVGCHGLRAPPRWRERCCFASRLVAAGAWRRPADGRLRDLCWARWRRLCGCRVGMCATLPCAGARRALGGWSQQVTPHRAPLDTPLLLICAMLPRVRPSHRCGPRALKPLSLARACGLWADTHRSTKATGHGVAL